MKKAQNKKVITHQEIQNALAKFQAQGGLIVHLPDQIVSNQRVVGGKWAMFEQVIETADIPESGSN